MEKGKIARKMRVDEENIRANTETCDIIGNLFTKVLGEFPKATEYKVLNKKALEELHGKFFVAEDYDDLTKKKYGIANGDLHYEPLDFIVHSAHFHKAIDEPTSTGKIVKSIKRTTANVGQVYAGGDMYTFRPGGVLLTEVGGLEKTRALSGKGIAGYLWEKSILGTSNVNKGNIKNPFLVDMEDAAKKIISGPKYAMLKPFSVGEKGKLVKGATDLQFLMALIVSRFIAFNVNDGLNDVEFEKLSATHVLDRTKKMKILYTILAQKEESIENLVKEFVDSMIKKIFVENDAEGLIVTFGKKMKGVRGESITGEFEKFGDFVDNEKLIRTDKAGYGIITVLERLFHGDSAKQKQVKIDIENKLKKNISDFIDKHATLIIDKILRDNLSAKGYKDDDFKLNKLAGKKVSAIIADNNLIKFAQNRARAVIEHYIMGTENATNNNALKPLANPYWNNVSVDFGVFIYNAVNDILKTHFRFPYTTIETSKVARKLWDEVYSKWKDVRVKTREVYMKYIDMLVRDPSKPNGWIALKESEYPSSIQKYDDYRFNMRKYLKNPHQTQFEADLPLIAKDTFKTVWYTNFEGKVRSNFISGWLDNNRFYRELYRAVYENAGKGKVIRFDHEGRLFELVGNLDDSVRVLRTKGGYFNINVSALVRKFLYRKSDEGYKNESILSAKFLTIPYLGKILYIVLSK